MNVSPQKLTAEILAELTKILKTNDVAALSELHARVMQKRGKSAAAVGISRIRELGPVDDEIGNSFSSYPSREALEDHLTQKYPEKFGIATLARSLKIPVTKADSYDSLINKIVDATVGYRLRAEAIRGRHSLS